MATTTNYSWTTPDDTALVKDGAAAIRSLGTAIDSTVFTNAGNAIAKTIVDAKGDLIVASGADAVARLAVGANDFVLTADSGATNGVKWAAVPSPTPAGADWTLLNSGGTTLTGAQTVTVSGISGKDKIMVIVEFASSASASSGIKVRLNTDTASNYYAYGQRLIVQSTYASNVFGVEAFTADGITLGQMSAAVLTGSEVSGYVLLSGCNSSGVKAFNSAGGGSPSGSDGNRFYTLGGYYNSSSTISSVSVFSTVGNLDAGTVYVYTSA
jgi:hypothetical protein